MQVQAQKWWHSSKASWCSQHRPQVTSQSSQQGWPMLLVVSCLREGSENVERQNTCLFHPSKETEHLQTFCLWDGNKRWCLWAQHVCCLTWFCASSSLQRQTGGKVEETRSRWSPSIAFTQLSGQSSAPISFECALRSASNSGCRSAPWTVPGSTQTCFSLLSYSAQPSCFGPNCVAE